MKAEVIREIAERQSAKPDEFRDSADLAMSMTTAVSVFEQAGFAVVKTEELEAALKPFAKEADAWEEMGDTRPVIGDDSPVTVADLRRAAALLAALTQEKT